MKRKLLVLFIILIGIIVAGLLVSYLINGGEHKIVNKVNISKPQKEVFDFVADMRNELKWNPDVQYMEKVSEDGISENTRFKAKWHLSDTIIVTIIKYISPSDLTFVNGGAIKVTLNLTFKFLSDSETVMQSEFIAEPNGFARAIFPVIKKQMAKQEKLNMVNLKNYIETR